MKVNQMSLSQAVKRLAKVEKEGGRHSKYADHLRARIRALVKK